jgi:hypothetical protein
MLAQATLNIDELAMLLRDPPQYAPRVILPMDVIEYILNDLNTRNRKQKPKVQKFIAEHGYRWIGGTIRFGQSGLLETYVAFGIPDSAFVFIDSGAKRTMKDALGVLGVPYSEVTSGAVRWIINYHKGEERTRSSTNKPLRDSYDSKTIVDYYQLKINKTLIERFAKLTHRYHYKIPAALLAAYLYMFYKAGKSEEVSVFEDQLINLQHKVRSNKAYALNQKIIDVRSEGAKGRLREEPTIAWIIQAINGNKPTWAQGATFPTID